VERNVKKASEYRKHAEECLALSKQVPEGEQRKQLLEMARTWNALADDRERVARKHPDQSQEKPRPG
jgi:ABC-type molybdate transport system substrate-binding protein